MLLEYIDGLMRQALYEQTEDGSVYGEIPACPGVWAEESDPETCKRVLQEVLEGWLLLKLRDRDPLPIVDGVDLNEKAA